MTTIEPLPEQLREPLYIHQSWVESASLCMARLDPRHLEHPEYDPTPTVDMSIGSITHAVIEQGIERGGNYFPSPQDVLDLWRTLAREKDNFDLDAVADYAVVRTYTYEVRDAYHAWRTEVWPQLQDLTVLAVEREMEAHVGYLPSGRPVYLRGTPDLAVPTELHDWKTSRRKWDQGKADGRIQGPIYARLAQDNLPDIGRVERMVYWVYDRSKGEWTFVIQEISEPMIEAAVNAALEWAGIAEAGFYPPTPTTSSGKAGRGWWCSANYCHAWDVCSYKAMVADGTNLEIKRAKGWR